jgi:rubrerythrin
MAIIDNYSKEELEQIVKQSYSMNEVIDKLGYATHSGSNNNTVKTRIEKFQIGISHFNFQKRTERKEENIFIEESTASQATLRKWYLKGQYTPYKCSICGLEPIWQGKELTLILDHINGKNHDDRLENLRWVCPNCNQQLDTTGFKRGKNKENVKKYYCKDCGIEISRSSKGLCPICANKIKRIAERPTRDELKQLIRNLPFVKIAEQYGVSDKAITKWCISENLPSRKKDIKKYSDKEWEEI